MIEEFTCSECGATRPASPADEGQRVQCASCGAMFTAGEERGSTSSTEAQDPYAEPSPRTPGRERALCYVDCPWTFRLSQPHEALINTWQLLASATIESDGPRLALKSGAPPAELPDVMDSTGALCVWFRDLLAELTYAKVPLWVMTTTRMRRCALVSIPVVMMTTVLFIAQSLGCMSSSGFEGMDATEGIRIVVLIGVLAAAAGAALGALWALLFDSSGWYQFRLRFEQGSPTSFFVRSGGFEAVLGLLQRAGCEATKR